MPGDLSQASPTDRVNFDPTAPLLLDLLEWLAAKPRAYSEVMEAWRTSCPRFPIWEDAVYGGLVLRRPGTDGQVVVELTPNGRRSLGDAGISRGPDT
jgi:hypothetical protein